MCACSYLMGRYRRERLYQLPRSSFVRRFCGSSNATARSSISIIAFPWNSRVEKREMQPQSLRATLRAVTGWNVDSRLLTIIIKPDDDAPGDLQVTRPVRVVAYGI